MKTKRFEKSLTSSNYSEKEVNDIIKFQRAIRGLNRYNLHKDIFKTNPPSELPTFNLPAKYEELKNRAEAIILVLTSQQAAIDGDKLFHYTTTNNLFSIAETEAILGAENLINFAIPYTKNTLNKSDIQRGDANIICCSSSGIVDALAYLTRKYFTGDSYDQATIKSNACRLTLNINKSQQSFLPNDCNQFFKLFDMGLIGYTLKAQLTDKFSFFLDLRTNTLALTLDDQTVNISLSTADVFFYGNIYSINRFALTQLYKMIEKIPDEAIKEKYLDYLLSLPDIKLSNTTLNFTKAIIYFAEYNFNANLSLSTIKIPEILMLGDEKIKIDLSSTKSELEYENCILQLTQRKIGLNSLKEQYGKKVEENETIFIEEAEYIKGDKLNIYGQKFSYTDSRNPSFNFSLDYTKPQLNSQLTPEIVLTDSASNSSTTTSAHQSFFKKEPQENTVTQEIVSLLRDLINDQFLTMKEVSKFTSFDQALIFTEKNVIDLIKRNLLTVDVAKELSTNQLLILNEPKIFELIISNKLSMNKALSLTNADLLNVRQLRIDPESLSDINFHQTQNAKKT